MCLQLAPNNRGNAARSSVSSTHSLLHVNDLIHDLALPRLVSSPVPMVIRSRNGVEVARDTEMDIVMAGQTWLENRSTKWRFRVGNIIYMTKYTC